MYLYKHQASRLDGISNDRDVDVISRAYIALRPSSRVVRYVTYTNCPSNSQQSGL